MFGLVMMNQLPERVPVHWGLDGKVDGYASRETTVWFGPVVGLVAWAALTIIPKLDPIKQTRTLNVMTLRRYANAMAIFMVVIHLSVLLNGLGWAVSVPRLVMAGTGGLMAALGNELGRLRHNSFAGIRTPWTLADDEVWRQSHRVGGRMVMGCGLVMVALALLAPVELMMWGMLVVTAFMVVGMIGYSYWVAARKRRATSL
ncbi:MAG: SdpI family protein [Anaerolineae bacterium]|nr:SdpI family protein [Anaerolineae bacterium]